jgi:ABC-2 type transport system permease protein
VSAAAAAVLAPLRLYLEFTRITFLKMLAYRLRYYTGVVSYLVFVAGNAFLFRAVYAAMPPGREIGGYDAESIVTYIAIAWIGRSLVFNNIDSELSTAVTEGNIALNLMKPVDFQAMTFFGALGELGFRLVLFTLPISIVVFPLFGVAGPAGAESAAGAAASFFLAFVVNSGVNFIVGTFALRMKSIYGVMRAKYIVLELLTGALVPLSFFPDSLRRVTELLPFQAIGYVPVTIYMGQRTGAELWEALALQAFWGVALYGVGALLWATGVRRTSVQGG